MKRIAVLSLLFILGTVITTEAGSIKDAVVAAAERDGSSHSNSLAGALSTAINSGATGNTRSGSIAGAAINALSKRSGKYNGLDR